MRRAQRLGIIHYATLKPQKNHCKIRQAAILVDGFWLARSFSGRHDAPGAYLGTIEYIRPAGLGQKP